MIILNQFKIVENVARFIIIVEFVPNANAPRPT